jgi:hypothetical protein
VVGKAALLAGAGGDGGRRDGRAGTGVLGGGRLAAGVLVVVTVTVGCCKVAVAVGVGVGVGTSAALPATDSGALDGVVKVAEKVDDAGL